jgi:hypothetical protein
METTEWKARSIPCLDKPTRRAGSRGSRTPWYFLCGLARHDERSAVEVGRYTTAEAIGVTTYANLFNVNPVIQPSGIIVFDDAHTADGRVGRLAQPRRQQ